MLTYSGERQVAERVEDVRIDHVERYRFASGFVDRGARVIDAACGIGYGSRILADAGAGRVLGVDISGETIAWARERFAHPAVEYRAADCLSIRDWGPADLVASFETIEHVDDPESFLAAAFEALRPGGRLAISTPNERVMAYSATRFPFHRRHWTPEDFSALLRGAGFSIRERWSQAKRHRASLASGTEGRYLVFLAERPE